LERTAFRRGESGRIVLPQEEGVKRNETRQLRLSLLQKPPEGGLAGLGYEVVRKRPYDSEGAVPLSAGGAGESVAEAVTSVEGVGEDASIVGASDGPGEATELSDGAFDGALLSAGALAEGCVATNCLWSSTVSSINAPEAS